MIEFLETEHQMGETEIRALEARIDFNLPKEYQRHLLKHNGGRCEPNVFSFVENGKKTSSAVDWFLAVYNGEFDNFEDYFNIYKIDEKRMPTNFFAIAHDSGGNLICMNTEDNGIYFWDHEREFESYTQSNDDDKSNLYFIAKDLDTFFSELKELFSVTGSKI